MMTSELDTLIYNLNLLNIRVLKERLESMKMLIIY